MILVAVIVMILAQVFPKVSMIAQRIVHMVAQQKESQLMVKVAVEPVVHALLVIILVVALANWGVVL